MMGAKSACSTSSTSSPTSAWPSGWRAGSNRSTSSTCCRTYSSCGAFPRTFVPTNGPEFLAKAVQEWIGAVGAKTAYIAPGSPWENGFIESFNARLRDELLGRDLLHATRGSDHHRKLASSLQRGSPACLDWLPGASPGSVRPGTRRMAGCATPTSSAGHAPAGTETNPKLMRSPTSPRIERRASKPASRMVERNNGNR